MTIRFDEDDNYRAYRNPDHKGSLFNRLSIIRQYDGAAGDMVTTCVLDLHDDEHYNTDVLRTEKLLRDAGLAFKKDFHTFTLINPTPSVVTRVVAALAKDAESDTNQPEGYRPLLLPADAQQILALEKRFQEARLIEKTTGRMPAAAGRVR